MQHFRFTHWQRLRVAYQEGVSNRWAGKWNEKVEWKMEWNGECTQSLLTHATGAVLQA